MKTPASLTDNKSSAGQSITFYNYTSDEHGSEGACIIFIQSQKVTKTTTHYEFEPNSRQTVLRQPSVIDNMEYRPHSSAIIIKLFSNSPFPVIVHLMTLFPLVDY